MIPRIVQDLARHAPEFRRALANHKWEATDDGGLLFPEQRAIARGYFTLSVNGGPDELSPNMLVTEGLNKILDVHYRAQTPSTPPPPRATPTPPARPSRPMRRPPPGRSPTWTARATAKLYSPSPLPPV